jgi:hypothetical protein
MGYYGYENSNNSWYVIMVIVIIIIVIIVIFAVYTHNSNPFFINPGVGLNLPQLQTLTNILFPAVLRKCPMANKVHSILRPSVLQSIQTQEEASKPVRFPIDSFKGAVYLSGDQVVPPVKTKGKGKGYVVIDSDSEVVHYSVHIKKLSSDLLTAQLQEGERGENGRVLKTLRIVEDEGCKYYKLEGEWSSSDSRQPLTQANLDALLNGRAYINIATEKHPQGEIRGQVRF